MSVTLTTENGRDGDLGLAQRFALDRGRLRGMAHRMLGSLSDADDALQEAWLKVSRSNGEIENPGGWLTTVVARVCLDMLRVRGSRREEPLEEAPEASTHDSPEESHATADAVGTAMLIVLDTLAPAERVAFVLHDLFSLSFEEIAPILDRTPAATRKLASRARQRVRGAEAPATDVSRRRAVVAAFLAASREGNLEGLLSLLSPEVALRADALAVRTALENRLRGAPVLEAEVRGALAVAETFKGRARAAMPASINGQAGAVWVSAGQVRTAFVFRMDESRIIAIDLVMEPGSLAGLAIDIK